MFFVMLYKIILKDKWDNPDNYRPVNQSAIPSKVTESLINMGLLIKGGWYN